MSRDVALKIDAPRDAAAARYRDHTLLPLLDIPPELLSNNSYSLRGVILLGMATYFGFPLPLNAYPRALIRQSGSPFSADPPIFTNLGPDLRNARDAMHRALYDVRTETLVASRLLRQPKRRNRPIDTSVLDNVAGATRNIEELLLRSLRE